MHNIALILAVVEYVQKVLHPTVIKIAAAATIVNVTVANNTSTLVDETHINC